jgi:3-hydroxyacyl-CoA dehydrogenase
MQLLKFAPFPTVSAPRGLTLGGGCEVSLHTTDQVIDGETYAGLVEIGVGLLPAGGGTKELALRAYELAGLGEKCDPMSFLQRSFQLVGMGKVSTSGIDAVEMGLYPQNAKVTLSRPYQVLKAKDLALHYRDMGYSPPLPVEKLRVVGDPGVQTFKVGLYNMKESGFITEYEYFIGELIAVILCGGRCDPGHLVSEQYLLDLERAGFVELCQQPKTRERIEHMLRTGKALRN